MGGGGGGGMSKEQEEQEEILKVLEVVCSSVEAFYTGDGIFRVI